MVRCQLVSSRIPDQMASRAILARGDDALELQIVDRVVFGENCKSFFRWVKRRAARDGPGFKHASHLKAKIEMQLCCMMLLHNKAAAAGFRDFAAWLRRAPEIS